MLRRSDESGAILVLFALSIVVMFGFMAIAVDVANAYNQRRESQFVADVSAVGGALQVIDNNGAKIQVAGDLVDKTMQIAASNLGPGLDWSSCEDPDRFAEDATDYFTVSIDSEYTECVSWSSDFSEVRVKLPNRDIDTFFAGLIGFDTVSVGAFAEVGQVVGGGGGVLPFGLLGGGTNGLVCLKTGPQFPSECDPNVSGNFNFLDFRIYGNTALGTVSGGCTGGTVTTLKENIAHGIDHDLAPAPSTPIDHTGIKNSANIIRDDDQCPDNSQDVQAGLTETGNKQKVLIDGFVNGIGAFPGRLTLGSPARSYDYGGVPIDDVGLWEYLRDTDASAAGLQNVCAKETDEARIIACVQGNASSLLFDDSIAGSTRLARVPTLWQTTWPSGTKYVSFEGFTFVYLQTLYGGCKNNGTCSLEVSPNETHDFTSADPVVITAIVIPDAVISAEVKANFGVPRVTTYAITR
ncbi:MAG: Tad domain-containing protein [Actinomycetia bacterium]|nr:Tad domain-containing protein [Actinomycetes bacterium]